MRKLLYILLTSLLLLGEGLGMRAFAQQAKIDSLLTLLYKPTTPDTAKLRLLVALSEESMDNTDVFNYAKQAEGLADKLLTEPRHAELVSASDETLKRVQGDVLKAKALALNNIGLTT